MTAATIAIESGINHAFVMMEPRLARSMQFVGIKFEQIGPAIEYHGKRAPILYQCRYVLEQLEQWFPKLVFRNQQNHQSTNTFIRELVTFRNLTCLTIRMLFLEISAG